MAAGPSQVRVGVDLTDIDEVAASIERFGDRYRSRLFTEHELDSCGSTPRRQAAGLAARFAAKEAAIKVLRPTGAIPEWRSIEVRRNPDGSCDMELHGEAARMAREAGIARMAVSLSHEGSMAAAVVVAEEVF